MSGKTYKLEDNALQAQRISFTFENDACLFTLQAGGETHRIPCGIGHWEEGEHPLPNASTGNWLRKPSSSKIASSGTWTEDNTFVMTWQLVETPFRDTVTSHFEGDEVRVAFSRHVGGAASGQDTRPVLHGQMIH